MRIPIRSIGAVGYYPNNHEKFKCKNLTRFIGSNLESVVEKEVSSLATTLEEVRKRVPLQSQFISSVTKELMLSQESDGPPLSQSRKLIPNHVDVYLLCSEEDAKYCELFCQLLISQNQALIIKKSFEETNSSRLSYLETSSLIIPLVSPSFLLSAELVHELNIAWCRQRYAEEFCFLEIILDFLAVKPTYVHLLPCFFNCKDEHWKDSSKIEDDPPFLQNLVNTHNVPEEVVRCFLGAIKCALSWITNRECSIWGLHNKLSNCSHLVNCLQHFTKQSISIE